MTQQHCHASKSAWFSSTGISHHKLLSHIPSGCLPAVSSRPCPQISPQSLRSNSLPLCLLGGPCSCPGYMQQGLIVFGILIPFIICLYIFYFCFFHHFLNKLFILIGDKLLYSIVVVFDKHRHESATGTHVFPVPNPPPPPSLSHSAGSSSQCTSPEHLASCIKPGPAICFTYNKLISALPSQIIPPSPFRLSQMSCFSFSLQCFSSVLHNCLDVGIEPLLQFPYLPRAGPVLLTPLLSPLFPSSYWVLSASIYSFLVGRYSCPLSAGVLQGLLCLKVYSWCIHGERCAPHSRTPPPSCPLPFGFNADFSEGQKGRHWILFTVATSIA